MQRKTCTQHIQCWKNCASGAVIQLGKKSSQKKLKLLLGGKIQLGKTKVKITNKLENFILPDNKLLSAVSYDLMLGLIQLESRTNDKIFALLVNGFGDSLRSLALSQFGAAVDDENRQEWLVFRQRSKDAFWELGNAVKYYLVSHAELSSNYQRWIYPNCQDKINRGLFGKCAKIIRQELKLGSEDLLRDHYNEIALSRLDRVQALSASFVINKDVEPLQAVTLALGDFGYQQINYSTSV